MAKATVGANADGVGDDAVLQATGRPRDDWFELLDAGGAQALTHKEIATVLVARHGVDPWWAQSVTVAYEQARGIRRPGQKQLGTSPLALNLGAKHPTARFPLEGGEFVLASSSERPGGRSSIGLTWGRMPDDGRFAEVKARMRAWLA